MIICTSSATITKKFFKAAKFETGLSKDLLTLLVILCNYIAFWGNLFYVNYSWHLFINHGKFWTYSVMVDVLNICIYTFRKSEISKRLLTPFPSLQKTMLLGIYIKKHLCWERPKWPDAMLLRILHCFEYYVLYIFILRLSSD